MSKLKYFLVFAVILAFAPGCACLKDWEFANMKCCQKGALAGMVAGAATGATIGHQSNEDGEAAAIGAVTGAVIGAVVGKILCKKAVDSDGDGVLDCRDKCPDTPRGTKVDANGCPTEEKLLILHGINFLFNSAQIEKGSENILAEAVKIMKENPRINVRIEGHTCDMGSEEYNMLLSQKRAISVKNYLIAQGAAAERKTTPGKGKKIPMAGNDTIEERKKNRRIEFIVTAK